MSERDPNAPADTPSAADQPKTTPGTALDTTGGRQDMPKWNRARVKRKTADEPDAFQKSVQKAGRSAARQAPWVIGGIILVAAAIAGGVAFSQHSKAERAEATRLLGEAVAYRARGQVADVEALTKDRKRPFPVPIASTEEELEQKVDESLEELRQEGAGSKPEQLATLVEAAAKIEAGEFADAQTQYRAFLDQVGTGHELSFLALEGIVLAREGQGDLEGAFEAAQQLLGEPGQFYRDQGLWHRGRLLEAQGKKDEAVAVYRQYLEEYPPEKASIAREQVTARLQELAPDLLPSQEPQPPGSPS